MWYLDLGENGVSAPRIAWEMFLLVAKANGRSGGGVPIFSFVLVLVESGKVVEL